VDAHKTGHNVTMSPYLRPKEYPDFMGNVDDISYKSGKILGRFYRSVKSYIHGRRPRSPDGNTDLEVTGASGFLAEAWDCKCSKSVQCPNGSRACDGGSVVIEGEEQQEEETGYQGEGQIRVL
jgi:RNA-dependent RNA polymerase